MINDTSDIWLESFQELVLESSLAPSVHNVQPAHWKKTDSAIELHLNIRAVVPIADPANRDIEISLGAAIEGLSIASRAIGFDIEVEYFGLKHSATNSKPVARITSKPTAQTVDKLAKFVHTRQTFRGKFKPPSNELQNKFNLYFSNSNDVALVNDKEQIAQLAAMYDQANLDFYRDPDFLEELNHWLRFSAKHERYYADGLNRESMALDPFTGKMASMILKPKVFRALDKMKLAPVFITESPVIRSATGVLFFLRDKDEPNYLTGRRLYRTWLQVEALGFALCPISSLTDAKDLKPKLQYMLRLPNNKEALLAFRAGPKPGKAFARARKPLTEMVIS